MVEGKIDGGAEKITAGKGEVDNGEDRIDEEDGKQDKSRHCERERLPLPEKLLPTPLSWAHNPGFNLLLNLYLHGNLLMKSSSVRTYNGLWAAHRCLRLARPPVQQLLMYPITASAPCPPPLPSPQLPSRSTPTA